MKKLKKLFLSKSYQVRVLFILTITLYVSGCGGGTDINSPFNVNRNPEPTFEEKEPVPLELVAETKERISHQRYLAIPSSMVANSNGDLFVYDTAQTRIFKLNKLLQINKDFGRRGEGPGEFKTFGRSGGVYLQMFNENLYAYNNMGRKILIFDSDLNLIDEWHYAGKGFSRTFAVDKEENLYFRNLTSGIWVFDKDSNLKCKLLEDTKLLEFLFFDPPPTMIDNPLKRKLYPIDFQMTSDSKFLAYSRYTANVFVYENLELKKVLAPYSKQLLDEYKVKLKTCFERDKKYRSKRRKWKGKVLGYAYVDMYRSFFTDQDDPGFFYLQYNYKGNKSYKLYRISLNGDLDRVYSIKRDADSLMFFRIKKNNLFYAATYDGKVLAYKEKTI